MPAPFNHSSGLAGVYDRTPDKPNVARVLFREEKLAQAAEHMEAQSITEARNRRVGDLIAKDGDRVTGAEILVDPLTGTVVLAAGTIYLQGDVRPVVATTLNGVPMTGTVSVGVRLIRTVVTEVQDPDLLGLHPGSEAEGEPGAGRETETIAWGRSGDGGTGTLFSVYQIKDGVVVDQTPPPQLSGVTAAIATYDRDAHGSYIVEGCRVTALGKTATKQRFSIEEGVANIYGFKRSRDAAIIHEETEAWDTETIAAEPSTFADGGTGTAVITVLYPPIASLTSAIVTKEVTRTIIKGTTNSADALPDPSVTSIIEVKQGGTTYVAGTSYNLVNDTVSWSPAGAEPATGSSYTVKYRYLSAVTPVTQTDRTVTLTGGVTGTTVLLSYSWKLPRFDLLCLDASGLPAYVKGVSMRRAPQPPIAPVTLLPLAVVENNWMGTPTIRNIGVRAYHFTRIHRMYEKLVDAFNLLGLERLKREIDSREPVAKKGVFVDPLINDFYRDLGTAQTAAVFQGSMQLPIAPSFFYPTLAAPALLNYTEEVVASQPLVTGQIKINPYNSYENLPASMKLEPPVDFWVDQPQDTLQQSFVTQQVVQTVERNVTGNNPGRRVTETVREQVSVDENLVSDAVALSPFMRQITVTVTISGFGAGENLLKLEMAGVSVKPPGSQTANALGTIALTFTIPANMPAGRAMIYAEGAGGSWAQALFVSNGYYDADTIQRTTTITRFVTRTVTTTTAPRPPVEPAPSRFEPARSPDPIAQSFILPEDRLIAGFNVKFAAFGDKNKGIMVELVKTDLGFPTDEALAQAFVDISTATVGSWVACRFPVPVHVVGGQEYAFIVRTNDDDHALALASIGGFDAVAQQFVGAQPYVVGMLLSSATATAWTAHQKDDLSFQIVAAKFSPVTKTISFGTFSLTNASDLMARASVLIPSGDTNVIFEIVRASGEVKKLSPNTNWELDAFVTEAVTLRAVLSGSEKMSPILFPGIILVAGTIATSATYVSRAMEMGTAVRMSAYMKHWLPNGSDVTVHFDKTDNIWNSAPVNVTDILDDGWIEREYRLASITAVQGRIRVTLTGGPAARPSVQDLRAVAI